MVFFVKSLPAQVALRSGVNLGLQNFFDGLPQAGLVLDLHFVLVRFGKGRMRGEQQIQDQKTTDLHGFNISVRAKMGHPSVG